MTLLRRCHVVFLNQRKIVQHGNPATAFERAIWAHLLGYLLSSILTKRGTRPRRRAAGRRTGFAESGRQVYIVPPATENFGVGLVYLILIQNINAL